MTGGQWPHAVPGPEWDVPTWNYLEAERLRGMRRETPEYYWRHHAASEAWLVAYDAAQARIARARVKGSPARILAGPERIY